MRESADLRYLESEQAIKARIAEISGRHPNAIQTAYVASCLLHGRLYWNSAEDAPVETRPLLLYYGAASYAKALILAKTCAPIAEVANSHGLSCFQGYGELVENYSVRANGTGVFQQFNDAVRTEVAVRYFVNSNSKYHRIDAAPSTSLRGLSTTLREILARVPAIQKTYSRCYGEPGKTLRFGLQAPYVEGDAFEIRIDLPQTFSNRGELAAHVKMIKERVPFLGQWVVEEATHAWDNSIVRFTNRVLPSDANEIDRLVESDEGRTFKSPFGFAGGTQFDALSSLPPLAGTESNNLHYVQELDSAHLAEHSLCFLGLFTLSSLVRYQPHVWTSCVHRRRFGSRQIDDAALPAIESFLDHVTDTFPKTIAEMLLGSLEN